MNSASNFKFFSKSSLPDNWTFHGSEVSDLLLPYPLHPLMSGTTTPRGSPAPPLTNPRPRRTLSAVRLPSGPMTVLGSKMPPANAGVVYEELCDLLEGLGAGFFRREAHNIVAPAAGPDEDAVHADFQSGATLGDVFKQEDDLDISFGASTKATALPVLVDAYKHFQDARMPGVVLEHQSIRQARLTIWAYMAKAFEPHPWILADIIKGDFYNVLRALQLLDAVNPVDEMTDAVILAANLASQPTAHVDFAALATSFKQLQQVFARTRGPGLVVGNQVLVPLLVRALSKAKAYTTEVAIFNQIKPLPSLSFTLEFFTEVSTRIGTTNPQSRSVLAFPADVHESITSPAPGPPRVSRGPPARNLGGGATRVCYAFQRNGSCLRGAACAFSHNADDIARAPPPPPMRAPKEKTGSCMACGSPAHGVDKCPQIAELQLAKARATPGGYAGHVAPPAASASPQDLSALSVDEVQQFRRLLTLSKAGPPPLAGRMAFIGVDSELQDMLGHARDAP